MEGASRQLARLPGKKNRVKGVGGGKYSTGKKRS